MLFSGSDMSGHLWRRAALGPGLGVGVAVLAVLEQQTIRDVKPSIDA
jgi:hypothetical protein